MIMQDKMVVINEAKTLSSEITIHVKVRVFLVLMLHVEMILVTNVQMFKSLWQMTLESRHPQLLTAVQLTAVADSAWVMDPVERACRGGCNTPG